MSRIVVPQTSRAAKLAAQQDARTAVGRTVVVCRLQEIRISTGLSMQSVADGAGVSKNTIRFMEQGLAPTLVNAMKVASFFELKIEDMWSLPGSEDVQGSNQS